MSAQGSPMNLLEGILSVMGRRNLSRVQERRVESALRTLERELGQVDFLAVTGQQEFSQIVHVPGSTELWVVYGEYGDGTMDIIKQDGIFPQDTLIGWSAGETLQEYWAAVADESADDPPVEQSNVIRPLFRSATHRRRSKAKK